MHLIIICSYCVTADDVPGSQVLMHCIDGIELSPAFMSAYMLIASFEKRTRA